MERPSNKILSKTGSFNLSKKEAWARWTTHTGLKSFIGADNKIELIPGGAYEIYFLMDAPEGSRGGEGNKVLSFLPEQMLSFSWNAPPSIPEVRNHKHKTWLVIFFDEIDSNHTRITLNHLGWLEGEKWDETYAYFENAWDIVMDSLEKSI